MERTIVIAEAGVNHNGSIDLAKKMIEVAAEAGADIVKFQLFKAENLVSRNAVMADYQKNNLNNKKITQFEMLKSLELSYEQHIELIEYCKKCKIKYLSTPFDLEGIDFLLKFNPGIWKIPSGEISNFPYLKKIAKLNQPVIMSTGMSELSDLSESVNALLKLGLSKDNLILLHCNTEYPTPMKDVNLNAMKKIGEIFGVKYGYSDHTLGIEVPIAAVALGASVIEKHFTLDRMMTGPDQVSSLEPNELKSMISSIRNIEIAMGSEIKHITDSEAKNKDVARKSIVASKDIIIGEVFSEENITVKRPGYGISPMNWESVIGKKAKKSFKIDDLIEI